MRARAFLNPYVGGVILGVVLFASFAITHSGLGASGAISRLQAGVMEVVAPGHVDRTGYLAAMGGGTRMALNHSSMFMLAGTFLGGLASAFLAGRLKPEVCRGPQVGKGRRLLLALLGGTIMGFGARLARGCTSGQALSGGAVLSAGSWVFMFAVFAGAYALAWFVRRLWN
jgi:uncharacterized membrane protein YedE/YeeE